MLALAFFLSFFALYLQSVAVPRLTILAFAPFLALNILRSTFYKALLLSASVGALLDLLSDDPMGLHALNYTLISALLFRFRKLCSHDNPLHLSLFSGVISIVSTCLQLILLFLFDRRVPFNGTWAIADLIGMPAIDALYAFIWIAAPLTLAQIIRRTWVLFWLKKNNPSPTSH